MWTIRAYNESDDELSAEIPLERTTLRYLEAVLGFAPTQLGSTPLEGSILGGFASQFGFPIEDHVVYFLDFDAEPAPERRLRAN